MIFRGDTVTFENSSESKTWKYEIVGSEMKLHDDEGNTYSASFYEIDKRNIILDDVEFSKDYR